MLLRPDRRDLRVIGFYTGRIITGLGLVMLLPALLGVVRGETDDALGLTIGAGLALVLGLAASWRLRTRREMTWSQAMAVVALSWLVAAFLAAVPLFLSGHYAQFIDAYFDAMSGLATAGLGVINDLDHVSDSINLWRHLLHFMGGQGLVLLALSVFGGSGGLTGLYIGEGREEKIMPNVRATANAIWRVSLLYGLVGTLALWAALLHAGMPSLDGLLHAGMLFMAAFDTGGFAPTAASLGFYHSAWVEAVISVLMVAGALSFALHHHLMQRRHAYQELTRNTETRFLAASLLGLFAVTAVGLASIGTYDTTEQLLRRGFFHILSAHTGTGFGTVPGRLFLTDWGLLAPAMLVAAMGLGGMAGSTCGGIKGIRVALLTKVLVADVRQALLPDHAVVRTTYTTAGGPRPFGTSEVRSAAMVLLLFLALYFVGALIGMFYGYSVQEALFESTSAAAAVGLSVGIVSPDMELGLKITYIVQMWIGRLEFISVFALLGYGYALLRGHR